MIHGKNYAKYKTEVNAHSWELEMGQTHEQTRHDYDMYNSLLSNFKF